jgi:hydrogenase maturation protein HypF
MKTKTAEKQRLALKVFGVVQGVGFRPFIYQLAQKHRMNGWVRNTSGCVEIEAEGTEAALATFKNEIESKAPPAARIEHIESKEIPLSGGSGFSILQSIPKTGEYQLISPDLATCKECQQEIFDPENRRFRYPFTNCTNCGPRFTIIRDIPYDRPNTTMSSFKMCPDCQSEYDNPMDRRFHAQPNACPVCGPQLMLTDRHGIEIPGDPLSEACRLLRESKILAIKGLGGFLLACDATNENVVVLLRERKKRPSKPFAVMLSSINEAEKYCHMSQEERELLASPACPIVLLETKPGQGLALSVAPGLRYLGVMLPYTPLHHLIMKETGLPLIMTSGNLSEEPIARDNDEALRRLKGIADYFLVHNRDIHVRYDDSVTMHALGETRVIRRARGLAPEPIELAFRLPQILACGGELKSAFCLTRDNYAFLSQHVGDLENAETLENYEQIIQVYKKLFRIEPELIACDIHPDYLSTRYANEAALRSGPAAIPVQHHHAHIAALLAEHRLSGPIIGVAFDGTGYGGDGTIWGGEFLLADLKQFNRTAHLEQAPLPGGDSATRNPYRIASAYLYHFLGNEGLRKVGEIMKIDPGELDIIKTQVDRRLNTPMTSSAGRLFDAVSALLGIRQTIDYEAQAAIELEMAASGTSGYDSQAYPMELRMNGNKRIVMIGAMLEAIIKDIEHGLGKREISQRFHISFATMIAKVCKILADETGIKTAGISGGCFQNRLLLEMTAEAVKGQGLEVLTHRRVPANDGGIALGQAVIAAHFHT